MTVHTDNCRRALDDGILATDAADVLVREGCTFREAHHRIGAALRTGEALPDLQVDTILQEKQVPGGPGTTSAAVVAAQGRWQAAHAEWQIRHRKDRTAYEVTAAEAHR
jgi:argininosuccinate lyase